MLRFNNLNHTKITLFFILLPTIVFANAPVIDISDNTTSPQQTPTLTMQQQLKVLKNQLKYLTKQKNLEKITALQQQVRDLRGLLEIQGHQLQLLQRQIAHNNKIIALNHKIKSPTPTVTRPSASPLRSMTTISANDLVAQTQAYQLAFNLITKHKYSLALTALKRFIKKYPNSHYTSDAYYWLGQIYTISGNNPQAKIVLLNIVKNYPNCNKMPEVLLQLGLIDIAQQRWLQARKWLQQTIIIHPHSQAAQLAKKHLKWLKKAGH